MTLGYITPVGRVLRQYRVDHDILLRDMAAVLGVESSWLSNIEMGRRSVPEDFVIRLSNAFRLTTDELHNLQAAVEESHKR